MISIIICSRTKNIPVDLAENIKNTIGCEYELIVIDNSENKHSIFEAYNLGIEKSSSDYLCLIHDDIFIHTVGWGNSIKRIFIENDNVGLIGIAGTKIKTKMPSGWWDSTPDQKAIHIIQHFKNKENEKLDFGFEKDSITTVVAIDGVFMAMRKDKKISFNTQLKGFHGYDLNISFEYQINGYQIVVTNAILMEHFSIGTLDETWLNATYKIHKLYKDILPLNSQNSKRNKKLEVANGIRFINACLRYKCNKIAFSIWKQLFYLDPVSKYHYSFWKRKLKNFLKL